jgi:hypothetical protein
MAEITTVQDYQFAAAQLATRVRQDAAFRQQILRDPLGTLKAAGLGSDAIRELVHEDTFLRQRISAAEMGDDCTGVSCICTSSCCVTCWFTDFAFVGEFGAPDLAVPASPQKAKLLTSLIERGHIISPR